MSDRRRQEDPWDEALRDHYRRQSLSPERLARLRELTETLDGAPTTGQTDAAPELAAAGAAARSETLPKRRWWATKGALTGALAATVLLVVVGMLALLNPHGAPHPGISEQAALKDRVIREIVTNHVKQLQPDVITERWSALGRELPKLDFQPLRPSRLDDLRLVGARYCSIQGHLAAQLRLEAPDGSRYTLYQLAATEELADLPATTGEAAGVTVELWQERGLLLGLAGSPDRPLPPLDR